MRLDPKPTKWLMITLLTLAFGIAGCGDDDDDDDDDDDTTTEEQADNFDETPTEQNIVELALATESLSTLASLVESAGLVETLSGGEFTVFAPTNDAFAEIQSVLDTLTADQVREVLTYHVIASSVASGDLAASQTVAAVGGGDLFITSDANGVVINGSVGGTVTTADVNASNGVVHIVDKVLLPDSYLNVVQIAQKRYDFTTLVGAVVDADLATTLSGDGPFTVFAPTNEAFAAIQSTVDGLDTAALTDVLTYHVIPARVLSTDLAAGDSPATVQGSTFTININGTTVTLGSSAATDATVTAVDIEGTNGVVHVIDQVLIP